MNRKKIITVSLTLFIFALGSIFTAAPVWSKRGEKKISLNDSIEKPGLERDNKKLEKKDVKKGKKKAKRKVLKKAGAAAAVGVATKKATSGLKKTVIKDVVK